MYLYPAKNLAILIMPMEKRKGFTICVGKAPAIPSRDVNPTGKPLSLIEDQSAR
jgi:hypothetical protein